jgi:hypothetical protein
MWRESWTAGAHRVNLAVTHAGASGRGWSRRVRHLALELSAFPFSYIDQTVVGSSARSTTFTTVASFTPDIAETKQHLILAYVNAGVEATGADAQTRYTKLLVNTENVGEINVGSSTNASVAGGFDFPFIIPIVQTLTAGTLNNFSIQQKVETASAATTANARGYQLNGYTFAVLQTASASVAGGPVINNKTVEGVGRGVASVIKTVGANRVAIGRAVANSQKTVLLTKEAVARAIATASTVIVSAPTNQVTAKTVEALGVGFASVIKIIGINREAVTRSVASVEENEILNQLLSAVSINIASMATSSQFRLTLESLATAIASISSRTTRNQVLEAVARAIAEISSRTTRLGNFVAFARNVAETIKRVNKTLEAQGQAIAADQVGYFETQESVGRGIAILADATRVTASTGTAAVVTANPYVLSLGDSVKRFKSIIQHGAGLGRGTTSDRDPDS